jgi:tetratricopeptide (TPR) repeat protein
LYADAEESLRRALALDSNSVQALTSLGRVLRNSDRPHEAVAPVLRAIELSPDKYSYRTLAALATQLNDDNLFEIIRSHSYGDLYSPDDGEDLWIGVLAVEVFTREGKLDWAEQLVNELLDRSPHSGTERRLTQLRNEIHDLRYQQGTLLEEDEMQ